MGASIVRPFLIAVVTTNVLFGAVPAVAGGETPSGSGGSVPDTSSAIPPGATLWSTRYTRPGIDYATALAVSPDGSRVFTTGQSQGSTSNLDYVTVAYDVSTGASLWSRRFSRLGYDIASALGVSPDGSTVFVTGSSAGPTSGTDYATVAYDASTGATLWVKRYNGTGDGDDFANALGRSPDGSQVFVTGQSVGSSDFDYATVAYDASTGATLWVKRHNSPGDDAARALEASPDGSQVFVTGWRQGSTTGYDYVTVAYDASTGSTLWVDRYTQSGSGFDLVRDLGVSPDGSQVFVTGESVRSTSNYDYATVAYDGSTGARLWVRRHDGPGNSSDHATALGVSPDGSQVFVTGYSDASRSSYDYATLAYDSSSGATLWSTRYTHPGNDVANALGVSADGSQVFVTGGGEGSTSNYDYTTLAYDASNGAKVWARHYARPGNDIAYALGVGSDSSKVFVTGQSDGSTTGVDQATVAYSTG